jgi:SAM-dependent methyltransferase
MRHRGLPKGMALDLGCGKGRNCRLLARLGFEVCGVDFARRPLLRAVSLAQRNQKTREGISFIQASVNGALPFTAEKFDIAIDTFCYIYLVTADARRNYRSDLARIMRPRGIFLLAIPDERDGFYGRLLGKSRDGTSVVDPVLKVASYMADTDKIVHEFNPFFELFHRFMENGTRMMYGRRYSRSTQVFLFRRNDHTKMKTT